LVSWLLTAFSTQVGVKFEETEVWRPICIADVLDLYSPKSLGHLNVLM